MGSQKDRKWIEKDSKRIEKGLEKDHHPFSILFLSVSYPFAIPSFFLSCLDFRLYGEKLLARSGGKATNFALIITRFYRRTICFLRGGVLRSINFIMSHL